MIRGRAKLRLRALISLLILASFVAGLCGIAFYLRYTQNQRASAKATAILNEVVARYPQLGSAEKTKILARPDSVYTVSQFESQLLAEVPPAAREYLEHINVSPPWFGEVAVSRVTGFLQRARITRELTPLEQTLDPATHSLDEIHTTLCTLLKQSKTVADLRNAIRTRHTVDYVNPAASETARSIVKACAACEAADGNPEMAVQAYVEAYKANANVAVEAEQVRVHTTGGEFDRRRQLDAGLAAVIDAFEGPVPDETVRELSALLDESARLDALKDCLRLDAASAVVQMEEYREADLERAWKGDFLTQCFMPSEHNPLYLMTGRNPASGLLPTVEKLLPLMDTPPHVSRKPLWALMRTVPKSAVATQSFINYAASQSRHHYHHSAMAGVARTVFALKQYKADHGAYPSTLDGITPALPVDPITGQALVYAVDDKGFSITPPAITSDVSRAELELQPRWHAQR